MIQMKRNRMLAMILIPILVMAFMPFINFPLGTASAATKLAAPAQFTATAKSQTQIALKWSKVSGAKQYQVYCGDKKIASTNKTAFTVKNLKKNTTYRFKVRAKGGTFSYAITAKGKAAKSKDTKNVSKIKLNKTSIELKEGTSLSLKAALTPSAKALSKKILWSTSDAKVAAVNSKGKVTAKAAGTCTVYARSHNGLTAKCSINVVKTTAANTIIYNGQVEQVKGNQKNPTALVIEKDIIQYVGSKAGAMKWKNSKSKLIDAKGRTVMPTMTEAHMHYSTAMQAKYEINLADIIDVKEMQDIITEFIQENPDLDVYSGSGWMQSAFDIETGPTCDILDAVCSDKPMILQNVDGHGYWANTKALEAAGITKQSAADYNKNAQVNGGSIVVDADGNPSGWLKEAAGDLINDLLPVYTVEQCKTALLEQQGWLASLGFTTFFDAGTLMNGETVDNYFTAMSQLANEGKLKVRVRGSFWVQPYDFKDWKECKDYIDEWLDRAKELNKTDYYQITTIKMMADQVLEGGTAYMSEGMYSDKYVQENLGGDYESTNIWAGKEDIMEQTFEYAAQKGLNLHVHQIGDAAATFYLDELEKAAAKYPQLKDNRVTMAHCQFINEKDQQRIADLGVSCVLAPYWAVMDDYYWSVYLPIMSSKEALDTQYPMQSLMEKGINCAFHSDYVVTVPDMGWLYYSAQTRTLPQKIFDLWYGEDSEEYTRITDPNASQSLEDYDGIVPIAPLKQYSERLTLKQTIAASTINGAKTLNMDDEIGSLEVGKKADLMILNSNLAKTDIEKMDSIAPDMTFFEGKVVYEK